jgi:hypothetical protein
LTPPISILFLPVAERSFFFLVFLNGFFPPQSSSSFPCPTHVLGREREVHARKGICWALSRRKWTEEVTGRRRAEYAFIDRTER